MTNRRKQKGKRQEQEASRRDAGTQKSETYDGEEGHKEEGRTRRDSANIGQNVKCVGVTPCSPQAKLLSTPRTESA